MADADGSLAGISEVVLRVNDLAAMETFYVDVVGLEPWRRSDALSFLKVADVDTPLGRGGHPQLVALVDRSRQPWEWPGLAYRMVDPERSTLDHLAFEIRPEAYESERARLEGHGLEVQSLEFPELRARAHFFRDPEENVVEFICHDPELDPELEPQT